MNQYIFLHLPKTAGSMFRHIVLRNFGDEAVVDNPLMSELVYNSKQIERLFYLYTYRFYMGHVYRLRPCLDANVNAQLIAFVRDPVEKALSAYHYLRGRSFTNERHPTKSLSFVEMVHYIETLDRPDSFDLDSGQMDWLIGSGDLNLKVVQNAVYSGQLLLFPTESFNQACLVLEKLFSQDFSDCSYAQKVNASDNASRIITSEEKMVAGTLPWMENDLKLLQLARESLKIQLDNASLTGASLDSAMNKFQQRCLRRRMKATENLNTKFIRKFKRLLLNFRRSF